MILLESKIGASFHFLLERFEYGCIFCIVRGMDDTDLLRLEHSIKSFGQLAIIIMNQTVECLLPFFDSPDVLACLLSHPLPVRMSRDSG